MLRMGDWVQVGERAGTVQAWGVNTSDMSPRFIKRTSRKRAYAEQGYVLVWFRRPEGKAEWHALCNCTPIPAPAF